MSGYMPEDLMAYKDKKNMRKILSSGWFIIFKILKNSKSENNYLPLMRFRNSINSNDK